MSSWPSRILHAIQHPVYALRRVGLAAYELQHPGEPWMSGDAVRFCDRVLETNMVALEWGSGRSTVWFARRVGRLTSVEHDRAWYDQMAPAVAECGNVDYRWIPIDLQTHPHFEALPRYVEMVHEFADESLDFVVVDGAYREACVSQVAPKLRRGGLLLVDNWNWMPRSSWGVPDEFVMRHKSKNVMTETVILEKP